jgi:hypothetical protein
MPASSIALVALALAAAPAQAASTRVDVTGVTAHVVDRVNASAPLPVLLPDAIVINGSRRRAYAGGAAFKRGWAIDLGYAPGCAGANACEMASFSAVLGSDLGGRANVTLVRGVKAHYQPLSCGASCAPPMLTFVVGRGTYTFSVKDPSGAPRAALIAMANAAIRAGARP